MAAFRPYQTSDAVAKAKRTDASIIDTPIIFIFIFIFIFIVGWASLTCSCQTPCCDILHHHHHYILFIFLFNLLLV
jgi:hypothetical protein